MVTLCLMLLTSGSFSKIKAEENEYYIADVSTGKIDKIESYSSLYYANLAFLNNVDNYDNLVLYADEEIIKMEYGVVEFLTNGTCSLNVGYRSTIKNRDSSINGCYGIDAAYLYSSYDGGYVYFKLADDIGYVSREDVILHPYELLDVRTSAYANINGKFYHEIKTQLASDYYSSAIAIDNSLNYLKDGQDYFSYDGHYFYEDFKVMIDDYNNGNNENAINNETPYYNYYQYLPFRSISNYGSEDIEKYFYDVLKIHDKIYYYDDQVKDNANDVVNRSQYYNDLLPFFAAQNIYGANALMMLSLSISESAYGKNYESFVNNNVFRNTAFDSDIERESGRYSSVSDSIYSYAKYYISNKYANYRSSLYVGTHFGNKISGIGSEYSYDPYWGEKAASNYYQLDSELGLSDYNSYCLGIVQNRKILRFYNDEELENQKLSIQGMNNYSLIILEECADSYKVQIDPSFNDDYHYDFEESVAYVDKDLFDYIINGDNIHDNKLVSITFKGNGGTFDNKEEINIKVLKGQIPIVCEPYYEGYSFDLYDSKLQEAEEEKTYIANFKKIDNIEILQRPKKIVEYGSYLDLRDCLLEVTYNDGTKEKLPINTNMIFGFDSKTSGNQNVKVNYKGVETSIEINVSNELKLLDNEISDLIDKNIESYKRNGAYIPSDAKKIKTDISKVDYVYDFDKVREIDAILLEEYRDKANYSIDESDYDLSISGLTLSLADANITKGFKPFKDTYFVRIGNVSKAHQKELSQLGEAYNFEAVDFINISYSLNMKKIEQNGAVVISLKLPNKKSNKTFTVYRMDDNGDIVKCKTTQSENYIKFLTKKSGDFAILSRDSVNNYDLPDSYENITSANSDPDNHELFLLGSLLLAVGLLGCALVVVYYSIEKKRKNLWKDFKKLLQKAEFVQEEKPKN